MIQQPTTAAPRPVRQPTRDCETLRARNDAIRAIARDIPDPDAFAAQLGLVYVQALIHSRVGPDGWRIDNGHECLAPVMRRGGLVEYGGFCLTAFGLKVRRALMDDDA